MEGGFEGGASLLAFPKPCTHSLLPGLSLHDSGSCWCENQGLFPLGPEPHQHLAQGESWR